MSTSFLTPNMSLVVPIVGQEPGPDWASDLNSSLTILDAHTHNPGSGVQITPSGININTDLTYNNANNAIGLRSVRLFPQVSPIGGASDLGCIYEAGVDLYYNDGAGNQIRITQSGSVAGSAGTITGLPSGTASASYSAGSGTFVFQQSTSTAANLDVGSIIVRYPGSYPTPAGNAIVIEAPTSLASSYAIVLPSLPPQTEVMILSTVGVIATFTFDQVAQNMTVVGADSIASSMDATGANQIADTVTRPQANPGTATGQVGVTLSSGGFSTSSTTYGNITNLQTTIITSGKSVFCQFFPAGGDGTNAFIDAGINGTVSFDFVLDGLTTFSEQRFGTSTAEVSYPVSSVIGFITPSSGSHIFTARMKSVTGATATINNVIMVVYELH